MRLGTKFAKYAAAVGLLLLPLVLQGMGEYWLRIADTCLLYIMMALGMNGAMLRRPRGFNDFCASLV